jgi:hypothetical protein
VTRDPTGSPDRRRAWAPAGSGAAGPPVPPGGDHRSVPARRPPASPGGHRRVPARRNRDVAGPGYRDDAVPGFEFERRPGGPPLLRYAPAAGPPAGAPRPPPRPQPRPGPAPPGFEFGGALRPGAPARPPGTAAAEWAGLLRSLVPMPARRSWARAVLARIEFRGLALRLAVAVLAMIALGVAVVVTVGAGSGDSGPAPAAGSLGFPPAALAGSRFTAAASGRGIVQTLGQVASDGAEIVAVGSQAGARIARAQFFVSGNGGRSWTLGAVRGPGGGTPPPGHAALLLAGGRGAWVAIGPDSVWTSAGGRTWTLTSATGLPLRPGDQVSALARTAAGFIAAGTGSAGLARAPVVFVSADGTSWRRLRLPAAAGRALQIRYAAAAGNRILIGGDVAAAAGGAVTGAAWASRDGGATWTAVTMPGGHGAQPRLAGLAAAGAGFVLVRPAVARGGPAADVYRSADGTAWTFQATLGVDPAVVNGGPDGAVIAGRQGRTLTAFVSADGTAWRLAGPLGSATAESVSGATATGGGGLVVAGTAPAGPASRQPVLTVAGPRRAPARTGARQIPGAFDPELAVNAVAAAAGTLVAVGSANGLPAAWSSADGGSSWTRAAGPGLPGTPGLRGWPGPGGWPGLGGRPGLQQLTSVTHGSAGWLAVGGVIAGAAGHPVVAGSADGRSWRAAGGEAAFAAPGLVAEQAAAGPPGGSSLRAGTSSGYVIVGYQDGHGTTAAAAWWSAGLAGWQRAAVLPAPGSRAPGPHGGQGTQMLAVAAGPAGFVAVGRSGTGPAAWTSRDGRRWRPVSLPVPVGARRAVLQRVASSGRVIAAVGTALTDAGRQVPFAARSADGGAVWTESALPVPSGTASVTALAAAAGGFTAAGTFGSTQGHRDVVVWTSPDGSAWRAATPSGQGLSGPGVQAITALATSGSALVGVGFTASPAGEQPTYWQSPIR